MERPEVADRCFAWLVDVFTATKAIAAAAMKSAPAMAMRGLRIEVVLDFILPPLMCGLGAEGPVQSNHCEVAKSGCGAAEQEKFILKRAGVKSNYCG